MRAWPSVGARAAGVAAFAFAVAVGCGGGAEDVEADAVEDVDADPTGRSFYALTITDQDGQRYALDRELTGDEAHRFAFGSTHIAPAVSLAMSDNVSSPATVHVDLNFGIVVAGGEHPEVHVDGAGAYPFSDGPPNVRVVLVGLTYDSRIDGSDGELVVDAWGVEPGDVVSGTVAGTLVQDRDGRNPRSLTVEGSFYFTLPERQGGQPR